MNEIENYLKKLGDTMDNYQAEMEESKVPRYKLELFLTPIQIIKIMNALHPQPYESHRS